MDDGRMKKHLMNVLLYVHYYEKIHHLQVNGVHTNQLQIDSRYF